MTSSTISPLQLRRSEGFGFWAVVFAFAPAGFPVRLALKDLQLVSEAQQGSRATMPLLDAALERFTTASRDFADQDLAAIYELDRPVEST